jgi:hypothetical protein
VYNVFKGRDLVRCHGAPGEPGHHGDLRRARPAAPSEQHRSRLTAVFFGASFTAVLAGLTLLSLVLGEPFFEDSRRRRGVVAASVVIFGGFATTFGAIAIIAGGSVADAVVTAVAILVIGVAGAGGTWSWRRHQRDREAVRFLRTGPGI